MDLKKINEDCFYFPGRVNIGYLLNGNEGMVIDSGIDDSTMKKAYQALKDQNLPVTYLFITHAHADHYGGASYLQQHADVITIAPHLEEAILRYPVLEPLYLFGGNDPLPELRNKFLEGKPITVDHVIKEGQHRFGEFQFTTHLFSGHSFYQLGLEYEGILYAGDAYLSEEQLEQHKIPYLTDAAAAIDSLKCIKTLSFQGALPGHGDFETEYVPTIQANLDYHQKLIDWLEEIIYNHQSGISHEKLVAAMCRNYEVETDKLSQWLLYRTAVTGYLTALMKIGKVHYQIENGRWILYSYNQE